MCNPQVARSVVQDMLGEETEDSGARRDIKYERDEKHEVHICANGKCQRAWLGWVA